jgi:DNA-binding transcriptional regulator WhiA
MKQVSDIDFLKEHDLLDLLDEHTKIVLEYRYKYPESSYLELADIISLETDYKIGKSGINHHFIKMKKLIEKYKESNKK